MEITSERHPYKFYLTLILVNLFLLGLGTFFLLHGLQESNNKFILGSLFFFIIAISINVGFIKNAPTIFLNKEGITFKDNFYTWDELLTAKLTGKGDMIFTSGECATLTFKDSIQIQIFDDFYSNISEIKCFIQEIVIDKSDKIDIPKQQINPIEIDHETFTTYKGNPVFSFRGIIIWSPVLFLIGTSLFHIKLYPFKTLFLCFVLSLFLMLIFSWMLYYFEISKNFIKIKNHYYFWKKDIYPISNIREVVIEQFNGKRANSLKIITQDFKTKQYYAGSLTDKTWLELKKELERKNITIRDNVVSMNTN